MLLVQSTNKESLKKESNPAPRSKAAEIRHGLVNQALSNIDSKTIANYDAREFVYGSMHTLNEVKRPSFGDLRLLNEMRRPLPEVQVAPKQVEAQLPVNFSNQTVMVAQQPSLTQAINGFAMVSTIRVNLSEQRQPRLTQAVKGFALVSTVKVEAPASENSSPVFQQVQSTQPARRVRKSIEFDKPSFSNIDKRSA